MSTLQKDLFKKGRLPTLESLVEDAASDEPSSVPPSRGEQGNSKRYQPSTWDAYFDEKRDVAIDASTTLCTYLRHATAAPSEGQRTPVFIMHHGAGAGGLSFGLVTKLIHAMSEGKCAVLAFDCRGHGDSVSEDDTVFHLARFSKDLVALVQKVYDVEQHDFILVGHSMGGSVVVDVAYQQLLSNVLGVVVMDVVEGSALEALQSMTKLLSSRPRSFTSIEQAIQWSYKSKMVRNLEACRLSIPPLMKWSDDEQKFVWRTDLELTQPYWKEWFTDLSKKFLGSPTSKLLLLAGTDRLDKELTIAQMQGKFQMNVVMNAGHFIHEDAPDKTATYLVDFWTRFSKLILPMKKLA